MNIDEILFMYQQENKRNAPYNTNSNDKEQPDLKKSESKDSSDSIEEDFRTKMDRLRLELDCAKEAMSVKPMGSTKNIQVTQHEPSGLRLSSSTSSDDFKMNADSNVSHNKPDSTDGNGNSSIKLIPTPKETTSPS